MTWIEQQGIKYFQFEIFQNQSLLHGIFCRHGGISPSPWASLNLGGTLGDETNNVVENRKRILNVIKQPENSVYDVWQVHSRDVIITNEPRPKNTPYRKADAILTKNKNVTLLMRFADCVPIFLYDPTQKVIGIVHAGWQGTVKKIVKESVNKMVDEFQSTPGDILAGIGPSIGPDHYEIGEDVAIQVSKAFLSKTNEVLKEIRNKKYFDLWKANHILLETVGVKKIEVSNICTACNTRDWYSHRAEKGKTGRFGAIISLA